VLGGVGVPHDFDTREVEMLPGVQEVHRITSPYKLAGRNFRPEGTSSSSPTGSKSAARRSSSWPGRARSNLASNCSPSAELIAKAGARVLRGGAFKPRSSPYSFQGLGLRA
jgi:3-deoxy-7-phosphoheptulonate synthase